MPSGETQIDNIEDDIKAAVESLDSGTAPEVETAQPETAPVETAAQAAERVRDEAGRFAKQEKATEKPAPENTGSVAGQAKAAEVKPTAPSAASPTEPSQLPADKLPETDKGPMSWRPLAREQWSALPKEVKEEWSRREKEMAAFVTQASEARKGYQAFREIVAPYEHKIRAQNVDPLQLQAQLMHFWDAATHGPQDIAAELAVSIIKSRNIPVELLAAKLDAQPGPQQQPQPQQFQDPRFDQFLAGLQQQQAQLAQQAQQEAQTKYEQFRASHEFFDDVQPLMRVLYRDAKESGRPIDWEQAYTKAVTVHRADPESQVGQLLRQKETQKSAATASAAMQRARVASSPRSSPAMPPPMNNSIKGDGDLVDALKGAFTAHGKAVPDGW